MKTPEAQLAEKIARREHTVAVVGLGYVGLPLVVHLAEAGIKVIGIDVAKEKIEALKRGVSYIQDVPTPRYQKAQHLITPTSDFDSVAQADVVNICVPTPLVKTKDPDVSYIVSVGNELKRRVRPGQLIILESTTYPGTTDELLLPMLNESGLTAGKDYFLAFSPERVDPGNPKYNIKNTPKVVGGLTPTCTKLATAFYATFIDKPVPVSSTRVAEMVKILENTFRWVNIGLINEISTVCNLLGIDTWETIDAAATKPFGFLPFYPGPGLGGHCIPVDPYYLSWKLKTLNYNVQFIELAGKINFTMPHYVVERVAEGLNTQEKSVKGSHVVILGVAYKENIDDVRESPALDIIAHLRQLGAKVTYHDPFVPQIQVESETFRSQEITDALVRQADCVVITTRHDGLNYDTITRDAKLVVDTRNATKGLPRDKRIFRL
jgi:UDP-N-acetyl-D-glucosamine dehydrogenase